MAQSGSISALRIARLGAHATSTRTEHGRRTESAARAKPARHTVSGDQGVAAPGPRPIQTFPTSDSPS